MTTQFGKEIKRITIQKLPAAVLELALSWLAARDVGTCAQVCTNWYHSASSDAVWKAIVLSDYSFAAANSKRIAHAPPIKRVPRHSSVTAVDTVHSASSSSDTKRGCCDDIADDGDTGNKNSDWQSRCRHLHRVRRNWKEGRFVTFPLIGHVGRISALCCGNEYLARQETKKIFIASLFLFTVLIAHVNMWICVPFFLFVFVLFCQNDSCSNEDRTVRVWDILTKSCVALWQCDAIVDVIVGEKVKAKQNAIILFRKIFLFIFSRAAFFFCFVPDA